MNNGIKLILVSSLTSLSLGLTACGSSSTALASRASSTQAGTTTVNGGTNNTTTNNNNNTSNNTSGNTVTGNLPAFTFKSQGIGYNSVSFTVQARKVVKVKFSPGVQDRTVAGTGFSPQYTQLGVYLQVGSNSVATPLLRNAAYQGGNGTAEESNVIDFSSSFTDSCPANDIYCRNTVTITVKQPNYDYWCITSGAYCPYTHVYDTHPWNGTLTVQTDDTIAITSAGLQN